MERYKGISNLNSVSFGLLYMIPQRHVHLYLRAPSAHPALLLGQIPFGSNMYYYYSPNVVSGFIGKDRSRSRIRNHESKADIGRRAEEEAPEETITNHHHRPYIVTKEGMTMYDLRTDPS